MTIRRFRSMARWVAILCAPGFVACYSYIPTGLGVSPRGTPVRIRVEGEPTYQVGDRTVHDVAIVDGEVIAWEPDTLALSAVELRGSGGETFSGNGYTVRLPTASLSNLLVKRFSRGRTALLVLGTVVGAILLQQTLTGAFTGSGGPDTGGQIK